MFHRVSSLRAGQLATRRLTRPRSTFDRHAFTVMQWLHAMPGWTIWKRGWAISWIVLMSASYMKPSRPRDYWIIERARDAADYAYLACFWPGVVVLGIVAGMHNAWENVSSLAVNK